MDRNDHLVHLENGRLAPDTGPVHVADLARRALESSPPNGLVIHFHGGLVGILYPHSLLYFLSGVAEGCFDVPLAGMARFYDGELFPDEEFPALSTFRDFIAADPGRIVWAVTEQSTDGLRSHSEHHGDFDNDEVTLLSLEHILGSGL